jgi:periplasmic mercuric ion binding protein
MKAQLRNTLIITTLIFTIFLSYRCNGQSKKDTIINIKTSAVCGMCKTRIEQGLAFEAGIKDVTLDLDTKTATVRYNPRKTSAEKIRKKISMLGHDADNVVADKTAYDKLPACCKKGVIKH